MGQRPERLGLAREFSQGNQVGLPRLLGQIEELNRKASIIIFEYIFKVFWIQIQRIQIFSNQI
jgi:hypothetical protein